MMVTAAPCSSQPSSPPEAPHVFWPLEASLPAISDNCIKRRQEVWAQDFCRGGHPSLPLASYPCCGSQPCLLDLPQLLPTPTTLLPSPQLLQLLSTEPTPASSPPLPLFPRLPAPPQSLTGLVWFSAYWNSPLLWILPLPPSLTIVTLSLLLCPILAALTTYPWHFTHPHRCSSPHLLPPPLAFHSLVGSWLLGEGHFLRVAWELCTWEIHSDKVRVNLWITTSKVKDLGWEINSLQFPGRIHFVCKVIIPMNTYTFFFFRNWLLRAWVKKLGAFLALHLRELQNS